MTDRENKSKKVNQHVRPYDPTSQLDRRSRAAGDRDSEPDTDTDTDTDIKTDLLYSEQEAEPHV